MSTYSNKENIMNLSKERSVLTPFKNNNEKVLPITSGLSTPVRSNNSINQIVVENKKKIKDLEETVKSLNETINGLRLKEELLDQYQSNISTKQNNNRIRSIQHLRSENLQLKEKIEELQQQPNQDRISTKLNNNRVRTIQKLTNENREQKDEINQLKLQIQHLQAHQQHNLPLHQHQHQSPEVNDNTINYHQAQMTRQLLFNSNYGFNDNEEHVGEC